MGLSCNCFALESMSNWLSFWQQNSTKLLVVHQIFCQAVKGVRYKQKHKFLEFVDWVPHTHRDIFHFSASIILQNGNKKKYRIKDYKN